MTDNNETKWLRNYFILSYVVFWLLLALTGYMVFLKTPLLLQSIMKNISAWSPIFVILILFKQLYPKITFKEYLRLHFGKKVKSRVLIISFLLQTAIIVAVILSFSFINNKPLNTISFISISTIIPIFIIDLTSGVIGEELGWRGYAINHLQKKFSPLKASLIVGVVWCFWHLPLMILSGFTGLELMYYIIAFMIAIISLSIIITFFYNKSKNILVAMWIHLWFNFFLKIMIVDFLNLLIYISVGYLILALIIIILNKNELLGKEKYAHIC